MTTNLESVRVAIVEISLIKIIARHAFLQRGSHSIILLSQKYINSYLDIIDSWICHYSWTQEESNFKEGDKISGEHDDIRLNEILMIWKDHCDPRADG